MGNNAIKILFLHFEVFFQIFFYFFQNIQIKLLILPYVYSVSKPMRTFIDLFDSLIMIKSYYYLIIIIITYIIILNNLNSIYLAFLY
jgi:hypothetical protein